MLKQVRANPDVLEAQGSVFDTATVLDKKGKRIGAGGAPNFVSSIAQYPRFQASTVKDGRFPSTADEAVIDLGTAKKKGFKLGDRSPCRAPRPQGLRDRRLHADRGRRLASAAPPSSA